MIDHVSIPVRDLTASADLYERILAPLGLTRLVSRDTAVGFGKRYPELWLNRRPDMVPMAPDFGAHLCLRAPDEAAVRSFFDTALTLGCTGAGDPGPRRASMNPYFGAFVLDPDGNKLEAATFPPPE